MIWIAKYSSYFLKNSYYHTLRISIVITFRPLCTTQTWTRTKPMATDDWFAKHTQLLLERKLSYDSCSSSCMTCAFLGFFAPQWMSCWSSRTEKICRKEAVRLKPHSSKATFGMTNALYAFFFSSGIWFQFYAIVFCFEIYRGLQSYKQMYVWK